MRLIVGLGNPGSKYAGHRHNIGFMALDRLRADHSFSPWKSQFQGLVSEGRANGKRILLLKPQTFMNKSGQSVGEALRYYKISPDDVVVFHDELDLAPGKIRYKISGGHAGHNGLRSIHSHIGETYHRVRIGIGHPGRKELVAGYVLHDFPNTERPMLEDQLRGISDGLGALAQGDQAAFLNAVALRVNPPRNKGAIQTSSTTPPAKTSPPPTDEEPKSALARLAERFKK